MAQPTPYLRLAELVASLSIATDLGTGHPMERALRACLFAVELGEACKCDEAILADIYYVTLLRFAGCAADARHRAALFGDEIALGPEIDAVELWKLGPMLDFLHKHGFNRLPPDELQALLSTGVQRSVEAATANCEIAQLIAARLGLGAGVSAALGDIFERWDGAGVPGRVSGDAIAMAARVATLALDAELYYRLGGANAVESLVHERSGGQYDPALAEAVLADPALCTCFTRSAPWDAVLALEPGARPRLTGPHLDEALRVFADFADLRLPWMVGHSTGVAELCVAAGKALHLPEEELTLLRHAAFVHDLGMAASSVRIWDKPGALSDGEWERVRLHPYFTERILARSPLLVPIGQLAALHHERLDGSGYHRQLRAQLLSTPAHILTAAETYRGMVEARPHRAALAPERAADEVRAQVRQGRLDITAVDAVLHAAGHPTPSGKQTRPAGLSRREIEVLRLLAQGKTNRQIADTLVVAPATVDHHVRHIYTKIGCSTRLAATMFALEQRLV